MPVCFRVDGEVLTFIIISRHECNKIVQTSTPLPSTSYKFYNNYDCDISANDYILKRQDC